MPTSNSRPGGMLWLERLAIACGAVAALFLCLIGVIVAAQIGSRLFGMQIPAADDFAAWCMAASIFLALPYAMLRGDHIRVTLLLQFLPHGAKYTYEIVATVIALALSVWCAWQATHFVYESFVFNELAQGMVAMPLWIPQASMPIGLTMFALMLLRRLIRSVQDQELEATEHG